MRNPFFNVLTITFSMVVMMVLFAACNGRDEAIDSIEPVTKAPNPYHINDFTGEVTLRTDCAGDDIHWEYEGADGPSHWGELCDSWDCDGNRQSPVNIVPPLHRQLSRLLRFNWKNTSTNIVNNGHTIQYNIDQSSTDGSYLTLNGQRYDLLQFHIHAASEHTVNGEHYPAEIHFVHRNAATGKLAVVGVFVEEGAANPFFNNIATAWPTTQGNYSDAGTYNPNVLLPAGYNDSSKAHFWYYDGSLTTPPCSEIVNWMVWSSTITASQDQIEQMEGILHENYRPTVPMGARLLRAQ